MVQGECNCGKGITQNNILTSDPGEAAIQNIVLSVRSIPNVSDIAVC